MANELSATWSVSATMYAVVRRNSDAYAWNGSAFEAYDASHWASYAIALTDQGGGLYTGDFPSAITVGTWVNNFYFAQVGGSPATTDTLRKNVVNYWNGASLIPGGGSVVLAPNALCSIDQAKLNMRVPLSVTTDDDLITQLINGVSQKIEDYCGRVFLAADYVEWIACERDMDVTVKNPPIINLYRVATGLQNGVILNYGGTDIRAFANVTDAGVQLVSTSASGTTTKTSIPFATYPTISRLVTQINTISGWSATASFDANANELFRIGGINCWHVKNYIFWPYWDYQFYETRATSGVVRLIGDPFAIAMGGYGKFSNNVMVSYRGGFESIPNGVVQVALELIAVAYGNTKTNNALRGESLGDYSWTGGALLDLTTDMQNKLAPYRLLAIAPIA